MEQKREMSLKVRYGCPIRHAGINYPHTVPLYALLGLFKFIIYLFSLFCIFDYTNIVAKYVVTFFIHCISVVFLHFNVILC